jgi:hypothetical protein
MSYFTNTTTSIARIKREGKHRQRFQLPTVEPTVLGKEPDGDAAGKTGDAVIVYECSGGIAGQERQVPTSEATGLLTGARRRAFSRCRPLTGG